MRFLLLLISVCCAPLAWAQSPAASSTSTPLTGFSHAYSLWGEVKYPAGFDHFDYVNVNAPKGGEMTLVSNSRISNFDKYNPFSLKGTAPAYLSTLMFESLLIGSSDEAGSAYGLLADGVSLAPDHLSVTFHINPKAKFNNGDPVLAADAKYSYDMLVSKFAQPGYRAALADVKGVSVVDDRTIRYDFKRFNRELPIVVGGLPVFSRKWGAGADGKAKQFDAITREEPIASGPYRIGPVQFGRDLTYVRDKNYWANDLNVRKGMFNFSAITIKIYKDNTAKLEAFKAGEFDFNQEFISRDWARQYQGKRFKSGELVKREFTTKIPYGFQAHVLNVRNPKYADVRVRKALNLAFDFEWMNAQLFYGIYKRVKGYFGGGEFEALGKPGVDELALLEPLNKKYGESVVPGAVFGEVPYPPSTAPPHSIRSNLLEARDLLAQAGWTYRDGALRNAKGEPFVMEFLDSKEGGMRTLTPWVRNLEKLGIRFEFRQQDFAIYQERLRKFEFEVTTIRVPGTNNPGNELRDMFGSEAAKTDDSNNLWGIANPAVDDLIDKLVTATSKPDALAAGKALDRLLIHGWYSVPQWYSNSYRVAYNAHKFELPPTVPGYFEAETWAMSTWWSKNPTAPVAVLQGAN